MSQQKSLNPQQPMMPLQKKHTGRNTLIAVIFVLVLLSACGESSNAGTVVNGSTSTTGNTQAASTPGSSTFKVGQLVSVGNIWQITVVSAKTSAGSQYNTPQKPGDVFLVVTIALKNISGQSQNMSSALQWTLQDSTGQKYDLTIDPDAGATLDGAVAATHPLKGVIAYEVPKTIHSFTLAFQNDIINSDQSIWNITV